MEIQGIWSIKELSDFYVIKHNGGFNKFRVAPFRKITENDLSAYNGYNPTQIGVGVQKEILKFYGLELAV